MVDAIEACGDVGIQDTRILVVDAGITRCDGIVA
jgi:hypothetical protein